MAVVDCNGCGRPYSSINEVCPHCGTDPRAGKPRPRGQDIGASINYLAAMLVAVIGAGWYYAAVASGGDTRFARWTVGVGITWYIAVRLWAAVRRRR